MRDPGPALLGAEIAGPEPAPGREHVPKHADLAGKPQGLGKDPEDSEQTMVEFVGTQHSGLRRFPGLGSRGPKDRQTSDFVRSEAQGSGGEIPEGHQGCFRGPGADVGQDIDGPDLSADGHNPEPSVEFMADGDGGHDGFLLRPGAEARPSCRGILFLNGSVLKLCTGTEDNIVRRSSGDCQVGQGKGAMIAA